MWKLYDYIDRRGKNVIKEFFKHEIQKPERMKLTAKLHALRISGPDLAPGLLGGSKEPHVDKIKVHGSVQVRLLLCRGPVNPLAEFTLLLGVTERDGKLPKDSELIAEKRRQEVIKDPDARRKARE